MIKREPQREPGSCSIYFPLAASQYSALPRYPRNLKPSLRLSKHPASSRASASPNRAARPSPPCSYFTYLRSGWNRCPGAPQTIYESNRSSAAYASPSRSSPRPGGGSRKRCRRPRNGTRHGGPSCRCCPWSGQENHYPALRPHEHNSERARGATQNMRSVYQQRPPRFVLLYNWQGYEHLSPLSREGCSIPYCAQKEERKKWKYNSTSSP